jgi:hypothetical protein
VPETKVATELKLSMDYFHVMYALHNQKKMLPNRSKIGLATQQVRLVADLSDCYAERGISALMAHWRSDEVGWSKLADYFMENWVNQRSGWWCTFLGVGTPRTSGGVEGRWPQIHRLLGSKKMSPERLIVTIVEVLLPYFARNPTSSLFNRKLIDQMDAVHLMKESGDVVKTRLIDSKQWFFSRRRSYGSRQELSDIDIDLYLLTKEKENWNFSDLVLVGSIRQFCAESCNCADFLQYCRCYHVLSRKIACGLEMPSILEDNKEHAEFTTRKRDVRVRQKLTPVYCFICDVNCTNEYNFHAHVAGTAHCTTMQGLYKLSHQGFDGRWEIMSSKKSRRISSFETISFSSLTKKNNQRFFKVSSLDEQLKGKSAAVPSWQFQPQPNMS